MEIRNNTIQVVKSYVCSVFNFYQQITLKLLEFQQKKKLQDSFVFLFKYFSLREKILLALNLLIKFEEFLKGRLLPSFDSI